MIWLNPLSANPIKWLNTLKQFVGNIRRIAWVFYDLFVGLALKGLKKIVYQKFLENFIRRLTIIILQANTQRVETLLKANMEPTLLKFLKLLKNIFGQIKYHMRTACL